MPGTDKWRLYKRRFPSRLQRLRMSKLCLPTLLPFVFVPLFWDIRQISRQSDSSTSLALMPKLAEPDDLQMYLSLRANARTAFGLGHDLPPNSPGSDSGMHSRNENVDSSNALTITQFSHVYGPNEAWADKANVWKTCRRPCQSIGGYGNATAAASADVVVLNLQDFSGVPWDRPLGQSWVGTYFESPVHYPNLQKPGVVRQFNVTMGFRADADLPVFNMVCDTFKNFAHTRHYPLPDWERKRSDGHPMMSVWISNCAVDTTQRLSILGELASQGVTYASYGRCQTTHSVQDALSTLNIEEWRQYTKEGPGAEVVAVATHHLFFLCGREFRISVLYVGKGLSRTAGGVCAGVHRGLDASSNDCSTTFHRLCGRIRVGRRARKEIALPLRGS